MRIGIIISCLIILLCFVSIGIAMTNRQANQHITRATPQQEPQATEAMYYDKLNGDLVQCRLCFRECTIPKGETGFCRVRENIDGKLHPLVYGQPSAVHIDPVEKEPQHHMLPGSNILCVGTTGCNYACRHCHNWQLSQASPSERAIYDLPPEALVQMALDRDVPSISFTYNDPIVFYEYVLDTAKLAQEHGIKILWHSNGSINPEPLKELLEYTDAVTIDLKGFSERAYENSEAELEPVLRTLNLIKESGTWLEIVNLIIPTINDDPQEIRAMCHWIKSNLGSDVPLHFSRFFPNYQLTNISATPVSTLERALSIAEEVGIEYVSIGNVPGHRNNSTFCPNCGEILIQRIHFSVLQNNVLNGQCKNCGYDIPGIWE